ncbi:MULTISPECIES: hypothetical protein [unclassified Enterococcus]|uniref:hypothetical protein n=1 Tax=unclassified Enterococcus TaxID=2608891 RepID=UPI0019054C38|nr:MULTISPECIES: hypothetical protein [unclassified Enterococcus]MBK0036931.1 hypothetical protein [Enterococcus sp. S52]MBK0069594.1 hypothetical protein [Enterococcus sp. S53]MBK0140187.1 hypothetical protein [Enterococcus sp. S76]MBK0143354.1 hypothetical protein [Enterococcus sp. S77]
MGQNDFFESFNRKYPAITQEQEKLNSIVEEISDYWTQIYRQLLNTKHDVFINMRNSFEFSAWTSFTIDNRTLKAERVDNKVEIFLEVSGVKQPDVYSVYLESDKPIFSKTKSDFTVNDLDFLLENLLDS